MAEGVPGSWERAEAHGPWRVPADGALEATDASRWLGLGNWTLYSAPTPAAGSPPDAARCGPAELLAWMRQQGVDVLIDSFHDDVSWVVGVDA